jgi:hypothetical protein
MLATFIVLYLLIGFALAVMVNVYYTEHRVAYGFKDDKIFEIMKNTIYILFTLAWPIVVSIALVIYVITVFRNLGEFLLSFLLDKREQRKKKKN